MTITYSSAYVQTETLHFTLARQSIIVYFDAKRWVGLSNVGHDNGVIRCRLAAGTAAIAILSVLTVKFVYISPQPPLRSWTWLYHQKANATQIATIYSA